MIIAKIRVNGSIAITVHRKAIPAGIIGAQVEFDYADDIWHGLRKTVVFKGAVTKDVVTDANIVTIPHEVVEKPFFRLRIGVYGVDADGNIAIPTLWEDIGAICDAAAPSGDTNTDPSLPVWAQIQAMIGNLDELETTARDNLVAAVNEAAQSGGEGGSASIAMRVDSSYIQYSTDGEKSWANLIALSELTGPAGPKGDTGETGPAGPKGDTGAAGTDGKSAYQYAVDGGYTGTEEEFAAKLAQEIPTVDDTLTKSGQAADAKAVGDRVDSLSEEKVSLPKDNTGATQNGTSGQILQTNGDGTTQWVDKPEGGGGTSSETADIPVTAEKAFAASVLELNHVSDNQYVAQHDSVLFEATEDTTLSVGNDNMIGSPYSANVGTLTIATVAYTEIENGYALDYADDYTGTKVFMNQRFGFNVNIKSGKTYTLRFYVNAEPVGNVYLYLTNDKKEPGTLIGGGNIRTGTVCQITFTADADYTFARTPIQNLPAEITKITLCEGEMPLEYGSGAKSYALLAGEKVWLSGVRKMNCIGIGKFYESPLALTSLNGIPTQNGAINSCATNKVWVNMGDSIWTFGASTGGIGTITDYMLTLCGGTWHNIATGGTTMASRPGSYAGTYDELDFWKIADAIVAGNYTDAKAAAAELTSNFANIDNVNWSAVDYVTVAYGTNDLAFGAAIDNESNLFDTATICGSLRYGIKAINSAYPNIRFKVLGVLYRNADSVPMTKIVECNNALKNAAAYVGAEFIDGYGINEGNRSTYLYDGTHPNGEGKQRIAETLARNIHDIWYS